MALRNILQLIVLFICLAGCNQPEDQASIDSPRLLTFGHDMPIGSTQHVAAEHFAKEVARRTDGRLEVKVFPAQSLGTDQIMINDVRQGKLDIALPPASKLTFLVPDLLALDIPFLFQSREHAYKSLDGEPGQKLIHKLAEAGLECTAFWESGFKHITGNKPLMVPDDFAGVRVRTMKSTMIEKQYTTLGAKPIPLDFHKTYDALKDGVVEAQENPLGSTYTMKFYEVQRYLMLSQHAYLPQLLCFSPGTLESLPEQDRHILIELSHDVRDLQRTLAQQQEEQYRAKLEAEGMTILTYQDDQADQLRQALSVLKDQYRSQFGNQLIQHIDAIGHDLKKPSTTDHIIAVNADFSSGSASAGLAIQRGVEMAIDDINARGGIAGNPLRMLLLDHKGNADRGIDNLKRFKELPNGLAVVGGLHSPVVLRELQLVHQEKIVYLIPWAAATPIIDNGYQPNYVFRVSVRDADAGPFLVSAATKKSLRIALLLEKTGWGRSNEQAMVNALAEHNLQPVITKWFNWGENYFPEILQDIHHAGAEVILFVGNAPEGASMIKSLHQAQLPISVVSHWGITGGDFWKQANTWLPAIDFQFLQSFSFLNQSRPVVTTFIDRYLKRYGGESAADINSPVGTAHAYDLIHLLAAAMGDSNDTKDLVSRLEQLQYFNGLIKHYHNPFQPNHHDALKRTDYLMARFDEKGRIVPVE